MPRSTESAPPAGQAGDRIAKLLARAGVASRREIERFIAEGRVARDGVVIETPATVLASLRGVTVDGEPVAQPAPAQLFLHHKPTGLLVTERDPRGRPTIYDRLPVDLPRVVPVGRLDLNTEGLLLLTTDGGLKRQLELPATGVERAYRARCYGQVSQAQLEELMHGVEIEGVRYGSINANLERRTGANTWIEMILTEGKNREVRRVLEHLGLQVGRLIRTRYGPFVLGDLPPGAVGEVRQADLVAFRQTLGKRQASDERIAVQAPTRGTSLRTPARKPRLDAAREQARGASHQNDGGSQGHPGAGRSPVVANPEGRRAPAQRTGRPASIDSPRQVASSSSPRLDPGLRRSGSAPGRAVEPRAARPHPAGAQHPRPSLAEKARNGATARAEGELLDSAARPAKPPQRKAGWAKPKPKTGPKRPGKR